MTNNRPNGTIPHMAKDPSKRAAKRPWTDVLARRLRMARGNMSQQELADRYASLSADRQDKISTASISSWESGDTAPSLENLEKISRIYGFSIDWFMGRGPEDLPAQVTATENISRSHLVQAAAAVVQALLEARRASSPEDISSMILAAHDWAASNEQERRARPSFEETVTFVRHAMKMRQSA